jgi:hypothetical protein
LDKAEGPVGKSNKVAAAKRGCSEQFSLSSIAEVVGSIFGSSYEKGSGDGSTPGRSGSFAALRMTILFLEVGLG